MVIYIDIDETICKSSNKLDYSSAKPIKKNIKKANKLFNAGHTIVYWTARGTETKINWEKITKQQFKDWGVKYHELRFGKPNYDLFIDDKNLNTKDWK